MKNKKSVLAIIIAVALGVLSTFSSVFQYPVMASETPTEIEATEAAEIDEEETGLEAEAEKTDLETEESGIDQATDDITDTTIEKNSANLRSGVAVTTTAELKAAIAAAPTGVETEISVSADINLTETLSIAAGKNIKIVSSNVSSPNKIFSPVGVANNYRHFNVTGTLTLENIILDGGNTSWTVAGVIRSGGLALGNSANTTLGNGAIIQNCYTAGTNGGGIEAKGGTLTIKSGAQIKNNRTEEFSLSDATASNGTSSSKGNGGGISFTGESGSANKITVGSGAVIQGNSATYRGGGISLRAQSGGFINLQFNGTLSDNRACQDGGGLSFTGANTGNDIINIENATISNNIAYGYGGTTYAPSTRGGGGACYFEGSSKTMTVNIKNSTLDGNKVPHGYDGSMNGLTSFYQIMYARGGAICYYGNDAEVDDDILNITDSSITNNKSRQGGGIYTETVTNITNSKLNGNVAKVVRTTSDPEDLAEWQTADGEGGAIFFYASGGEDIASVTITGGEIKGNHAFAGGGVAYSGNYAGSYWEKYIKINGTDFGNNIIDSASGYNWDINNPRTESPSESYWATAYNNSVSNVSSLTSPYTNIWNNADVEFRMSRKLTLYTRYGDYKSDVAAAGKAFNNLLTHSNEYYEDYMGMYGMNFNQTTSFAINVLYGTTLIDEFKPTKSGTTFVGWMRADYKWLGDLISNGERVLENTKLYAIYEEDYIPVTYNEGTSDAVANIPANTDKVLFQTQYNVPTNVPTRDGYTFTGWKMSVENYKLDSNGDPIIDSATGEYETEMIEESTVYNGGESITVPGDFYDVKVSIAFTAQWEKKDEPVEPLEPTDPEEPTNPEEPAKETPKEEAPSTNDNAQILWVISLMVVAGGSLALLIRRKENK